MLARAQKLSNRTLLVVVLLSLVFAFVGPQLVAQAASSGSSTGTDAIAVNPATAGGIDKSRTRFDYRINPGQPARDSIYVVNTGTTDQDVTLYARDAFAGAKGEFLIQDQKVQPTDVGAWVVFDNKKSVYNFTLKPHGFLTVPFDVNTPSNASPGDHVGAIVASAVTKGTSLNIVRRVAVRLYARLSGQIKARLELTNVQATTYANPFNPFASNQVVSYDIENVGNVELAADVSVTTSGPLGMLGGVPGSVRITNLLPGSKRHVSQTVPGAGQLVVSATSVVFIGILTSDQVAAQQPRGRTDVSSLVLPIGWIVYLGFAALLVIAWRSIVAARRNAKRKIDQNREKAS